MPRDAQSAPQPQTSKRFNLCDSLHSSQVSADLGAALCWFQLVSVGSTVSQVIPRCFICFIPDGSRDFSMLCNMGPSGRRAGSGSSPQAPETEKSHRGTNQRGTPQKSSMEIIEIFHGMNHRCRGLGSESS